MRLHVFWDIRQEYLHTEASDENSSPVVNVGRSYHLLLTDLRASYLVTYPTKPWPLSLLTTEAWLTAMQGSVNYSWAGGESSNNQPKSQDRRRKLSSLSRWKCIPLWKAELNTEKAELIRTLVLCLLWKPVCIVNVFEHLGPTDLKLQCGIFD